MDDYTERIYNAGREEGKREGYREGVLDATESLRTETEIKIERIRGELLDD